MSEQSDLNNYRNEINEIDAKLVQLLENRFLITKKVGDYKKNNVMPVYQSQREEEVINRIIRMVDSSDSKDYIITIMKSVLAESKNQQKLILNDK